LHFFQGLRAALTCIASMIGGVTRFSYGRYPFPSVCFASRSIRVTPAFLACHAVGLHLWHLVTLHSVVESCCISEHTIWGTSIARVQRCLEDMVPEQKLVEEKTIGGERERTVCRPFKELQDAHVRIQEPIHQTNFHYLVVAKLCAYCASFLSCIAGEL
jgi:hypothetical protein